MQNLWRKKLVNSPMCPICANEPASLEHTFLFCEWTRGVWFGSQIQCVPDRGNVTTLHDWINCRLNGWSNQGEFSIFASISLCCSLWSIWKERNLAVFEKKRPDPVATIKRANLLIDDYFSFWKGQSRVPPSQGLQPMASKVWRPPPKGMLKLNSDASFNSTRLIANAGIIIQNEKGEVCMGLTKVFLATSPLVAEALSMRESMIFAKSLGIKNIIFESDCQELVKACRDGMQR